jgi:hypothetical protein
VVTAPLGPGAGEIAARLRERVADLAPELLPDGRREGVEWRAKGPDGGTWCVVLRGHKAGVFCNWGDDRMAGDCLELVRWAVCRGDRGDAYRWALRWLGLEASAATRPPPPPPRPRPDDRQEAERKRKAALARFLEAVADIRDTPAELYLHGRAIDLRQLADLPRALRFGQVWHAELERKLPAMVAAIIEPAGGQHLATHTTYLEHVGGVWRKARVRAPKMVLGAFRGGVIPLQRGASRQPIRRAPAGDKALLAEGIEDGLTMALAHPERRALAGISVSHMVAIDLPPSIQDILFVLQRDGENDAVRRTREAVVKKWIDEGRTVTVWRPPESFKDANEYWQWCAAQAAEAEGAA